MSQHLSQDVAQRYRRRILPPAELIAAVDHLLVCHECRQMLGEVRELASRINDLRSELNGSIESGHVPYSELEAYVDGTLKMSRRLDLDDHFKICLPCTEELEDLQSSRLHLAEQRKTAAAVVGSSLRVSIWNQAKEWVSQPAANPIAKMKLGRWHLLCWAAVAAGATLVIPAPSSEINGYALTIGMFMIITDVCAVCISMIRRVFFRFVFLNLYWIIRSATYVALYATLRRYGVASAHYSFLSYSTYVLQSVVLFLAMSELSVRIIGKMAPGKKVVLWIACWFFLASILFTFFVDFQPYGRPMLDFAVQLIPNLFFALVMFVLLLWAWRIYHEPADWMADGLFILMGINIVAGALAWGAGELYFPYSWRILPVLDLGVVIGACFVLGLTESSNEQLQLSDVGSSRSGAFERGR